MPTLSVLLCNYNHGKYVAKAIEAIANQSRPPDEFIIVEDGSTDDSSAIIEALAARYPIIKFSKNEKNLGLMRSFEYALSCATGDYIYTAASDDYLLPGFFEKAMQAAANNPELGLVFGKIEFRDPAGNVPYEGKIREWSTEGLRTPGDFAKVFIRSPMFSAATGAIVRRDRFIEVGGFRPELGPIADFFLFHAIVLKYGGYYIPHRIAVFNLHEESYGNAQFKSESRRLELIEHAVQLMRSPEFSDRFPPRQVLRFEYYASEFWARPFDPKSHAMVPMSRGHVIEAFIALADWDSPTYMIAALLIRMGAAVVQGLGSFTRKLKLFVTGGR